MKKYDLSKWYNLYNMLVKMKYFTNEELELCMCLLTIGEYKDQDTKDNSVKIKMLSDIFYARYGTKVYNPQLDEVI